MLLKTQTVAGGFPSIAGQVPGLSPDPERAPGWRAAGSKALQDLLRASALPLRLASLLALTSGALSLLYSLYVVGIYFLKSTVERGWTTLSLQISGMMFLFSLLFALLAEYVLAIYRGMPPKRRYIITRELRSPHRRSRPRLNVINEGGDFYLGMPLASPESPLSSQQPSGT
jgi:polyisoprenyl-phosphate glycosyltransferase